MEEVRMQAWGWQGERNRAHFDQFNLLWGCTLQITSCCWVHLKLDPQSRHHQSWSNSQTVTLQPWTETWRVTSFHSTPKITKPYQEHGCPQITWKTNLETRQEMGPRCSSSRFFWHSVDPNSFIRGDWLRQEMVVVALCSGPYTAGVLLQQPLLWLYFYLFKGT